jgi:hypothetical protein
MDNTSRTAANSRARSSSIGGDILSSGEGTSPSLNAIGSSNARRPSAAGGGGASHSPPSAGPSSSTSSNKMIDLSLAPSVHMTKRVDVVILCGSSGYRLFPLTINTPKCMLPICNFPALSYLLASLQKLGFIDIILVRDLKLIFSFFLVNLRCVF